MKNVQRYFLQGFAMVVSPNRVADCDIFFRTMGNSPQITGVDLYSKEMVYLGFVYPSNISLDVKRAMLAFIRQHKKNWHRVHTNGIVQR